MLSFGITLQMCIYKNLCLEIKIKTVLLKYILQLYLLSLKWFKDIQAIK